MFNPTEILIESFVNIIRHGYQRTYGGSNQDYQEIICWAGNMALENIANSDALYHNMEHTMVVTLVGQEILRGKHIREGGVSCKEWLHYMISLVCHDIGYVKGVCRADKNEISYYATGVDRELIYVHPGSTDAILADYHVERSKLFIEERFGGHKLIDAEIIKDNISLTRFPVPLPDDPPNSVDYPGLIRAADLIAQLCDPSYHKKHSALYHEFLETGFNKVVECNNPTDIKVKYPDFFWNHSYPFIKDALNYLELTINGKQIIANLLSNKFKRYTY